MSYSIADRQADVVADEVGEALRDLQAALARRGVQTQCAHLRVQLPSDEVVEVRYDPHAPPGEPELTECVRPA